MHTRRTFQEAQDLEAQERFLLLMILSPRTEPQFQSANSLRHPARPKLRYGPYRTPRFRYGSVVQCEMQGSVRIVAMSNGRIPWPKGRKVGGTAHGFVLYRDLAKAVEREAGIAVAFWWGVRPDTVSRWRKALGVERSNKGSHALWSANAQEPWCIAARRKAWAKSKTPKAIAKHAAKLRGRPPPQQVIEAARLARLGMKHTAEARQKMSETHRQLWKGRPEAWTKAEDALVRRLPAPEVARRTGRSLAAVYNRRHELGVPDGRRLHSGKVGRRRE
jgi:hypothetical protein